MNKLAIITGLAGLALGATGGYLACHLIEKKKIDQAISDGVQETLSEIRGNQRQKIMENEEKKTNIINAIPHFNAVDIAKDIAKDSGYVSEESSDSKEPEGSPDEDDDGLPFDAEKDAETLTLAEKHNIWDEEDPSELDSVTQEEYDDEQEPEKPKAIEDLDPKKAPYPITEDQWSNEFEEETAQGFWDKITVMFFKDNVFAERVRYNEFETMSSQETELAFGKDNVKKFIEDRSLGRIFIRNNRLTADYEIIRSPRSYSSAMHEEDEEE
jgi:hypothetical protein